jgi:hypothetical protein
VAWQQTKIDKPNCVLVVAIGHIKKIEHHFAFSKG